MNWSLGRIGLAVGLNAAFVVFARWRRSVSTSGACGAFVIGAGVLILGGFGYWSLLVLFFITSTVASRIGRSRKTGMSQMHERGDQRDLVQVAANGLPALAAVIALAVTGHQAFGVATAATLAATNADTWGSEIGVLSARSPRSILTGETVPVGLSGGVTWEGTIASLAGALLVGAWFAGSILVSGIAGSGPIPQIARIASLCGIVAVSGFTGSVVDSVLGASVQAQYVGSGDAPTERRTGEGGPNRLIRGWRWMTNDVVNLLSASAAGVLGGVLSLA